jgi:hypothetical protein
MRLVEIEVKLGIIKGIIFGIYHSDYTDNGVFERDFNIALGIFNLKITFIYNDEE